MSPKPTYIQFIIIEDKKSLNKLHLLDGAIYLY